LCHRNREFRNTIQGPSMQVVQWARTFGKKRPGTCARALGSESGGEMESTVSKISQI
jgi:hypothetical protein